MPRYYFDTADNGQFARDVIGIELADVEAARQHVGKLLPDMAHSGLPDGDLHTFGCTIRDEAGENVYNAELTYHGRLLGPAKR